MGAQVGGGAVGGQDDLVPRIVIHMGSLDGTSPRSPGTQKDAHDHAAKTGCNITLHVKL